MELLQILTNQLGVSEEQAKGGSGLLFKMAKKKLAPEEFSEVASAVPNVEDLISSVPKAGIIEKITSSLHKESGELGNLASLAGGFKKLHLGPDMIGKFVPIIISFAQSKGGKNLKNILEKVMK